MSAIMQGTLGRMKEEFKEGRQVYLISKLTKNPRFREEIRDLPETCPLCTRTLQESVTKSARGEMIYSRFCGVDFVADDDCDGTIGMSGVEVTQYL